MSRLSVINTVTNNDRRGFPTPHQTCLVSKNYYRIKSNQALRKRYIILFELSTEGQAINAQKSGSF